MAISRNKARSVDCCLSLFADALGSEYAKNSDVAERKKKGQFFTPKEVSLFMAKLFTVKKANIRLLDPGAGIGSLTAAFCETIKESKKPISLTADLYETDEKVIPKLRDVLIFCKHELTSRGHRFDFNIIKKNFILGNPNFLKSHTLFSKDSKIQHYDYIISNPPYYKLNKNSEESVLMKEFVSGQPNIYAFFMALSLEMLKPKGEMVFITPRSFCSGLYFSKFRKWLVRNGIIDSIHIFDSRKSVFGDMDVLQENVIVKMIAEQPQDISKRKVTISISHDSQFRNIEKISFSYKDLFHKKNGDIFIKIPSKRSDIEVQHAISKWKDTLDSLGMKASTGPVVSFRAREFLNKTAYGKGCVPLLWMHNLKGFEVKWPIDNNKAKELSIKEYALTKNILLPVKNYVLVKRFSSKEQNRRLYAAVFKKENYRFNSVGIENHLNYIYKKSGELSLDEAYGIAVLLNSAFIDKFFRMLNGNTQVNVVDLNNLPFPNIGLVTELGRRVRKDKVIIGYELDSLIADVLGIGKKILNTIYGEERNGKN